MENLSDLTAPFRALLKKDVIFYWDENLEKAFNRIKESMSKQPVLKFFDINEHSVISVDASQEGLGACLMQGGRPCAYASRSLTETQKRYSQKKNS